MSRLHDMGGRFGDGSIPVPRDNDNEVTNCEPTFKHEWHAKAWAITLAAGALGEWNLDISRHYRECLPPKDYINFSYYEKWLAALTNLLIDKKLVSLDEPIANSSQFNFPSKKAPLFHKFFVTVDS